MQFITAVEKSDAAIRARLLFGRFTALLALIAYASAAYAAVEPIVATSWDVRRDAEELVADLQNKSSDPHLLLERVQTMLDQHGDSLIGHKGLFAPLSDILSEQLAGLSLDDDFTTMFSGAADRRLAELKKTNAPEREWRHLAIAYPGTQAALAAWTWLANRSWDTGRLGLYLSYAGKAGEATDATLKERVATARKLLAPRTVTELPQSLDNLDEMWRLDIEESQGKLPIKIARDQQSPTSPACFSLSQPDNGLIAASDGLRFFLFDHLVGRIQGRIHVLGDGYLPLSPRQCAPAAGPDGFIAIGVQPQHATLVAINRLGEQRWRITSPTLGRTSSVSAPLIVDDLVLFSALQFANEGPEFRIYAYHASTGKPAWDRLIAKLPALLGQFFDGSRQSLTAPILCKHAGSVLVLSNSGVIAQLSSDGAIERIWNYPSASNELNINLDNPTFSQRDGMLCSDGYYAVATPADNDALVLILGPDDKSPRAYTGDGSNGQVIGVNDGIAILGGTQIACLDLRQGKLKWTRSSPEFANVTGTLGAERALVVGKERLALIDAGIGTVKSMRKLDPPLTYAVVSGMLVLAANDHIVALGRAQEFMNEQLANAKRDPKDFRSLIALSSLSQAQGNSEAAYDYLLQALKRGAPTEYAAHAARLVRLRIELALEQPKQFAPLLGQLQALVPFDAHIGGEVSLWQGRQAERAGNATLAARSYESVLKFPPLRMTVGNHLELLMQAQAQAGLARLKAAEVPAWMQPFALNNSALPAAAGIWTNDGLRGTSSLMTADLIVGYVNGVLAAHRIADGSEAWWRKPNRPLLGVGLAAERAPLQRGVTLNVLDGTSAASAGLQTNDVLLSFNGHVINNFQADLIPAVWDTGIRGKFKAEILRNGVPMTIEGVLGGELVSPIAANARTVLAWPVNQSQGPEGMWMSANDLATGKELWRQTISPTTNVRQPTLPILTADDIVVTSDGDDLVGIDVRAPGGDRAQAASNAVEKWRLQGLSDWLEAAQVLSDHIMLLSDSGHSLVRIIDARDGNVLFVLPANGEKRGLLDKGDLAALGLDGRLACWDLGEAKLRWRSDKKIDAAITMAGDAVFAKNDAGQLVMLDRYSGKVRRLYGEWNSIEDWRLEESRLYVYGHAGNSHAVAAIGLPGGAILWQSDLPNGIEQQQLFASAEGVGCVLGKAGEDPALLSLDRDGGIRQATQLKEDEFVFPLKSAMLAVGKKGMRVLADALPEAPAAVPAINTPMLDSLEASSALVPQLQWQKVGDASYALARMERSLLVFAKLPGNVESMNVRIGDGGPGIDQLSQMLIFQRLQVPRFNDSGNGWTLAGSQRLGNDDKEWLSVARLDPKINRTAGLPVQIRARCGKAVDGPAAPWWLRSAWRTVVAADKTGK